MDSFGKSLRQQREFRDISLEEVAESTMINLRFLQAIEDERFQDLPHPTFVKGFLRAYAKHLGLDADEIVLGYEQYLQSQQTDEPEQKPEQYSNSCKIKLGEHKAFPFPIAIAAGVILIGSFTFFFWPESSKNGVQKPVEISIPDKATKPAPQPKTIAVENKTQSNGPLTTKEEILASASIKEPQKKSKKTTAPATAAKPAKPAEEKQTGKKAALKKTVAPQAKPLPAQTEPKISLKIEATEDTWILAEVDAIDTLDFYLREGQNKIIRASHKIVFKSIGNGGGLTFSMGDQSLPLGAKSGQVLHDITIEEKTVLKKLVEEISARR